MDISEFRGSLGRLIKNKQKGYYSFVPAQLPIKLTYDEELVAQLADASKKIGELNGMSPALDQTIGFSPINFIRPYLRKEAVLSSRIEGTMSTLYDVLEAEAKNMLEGGRAKGNHLEGLLEVINYIKAQDEGIKLISNGRDIDKELIMELHAILLRYVRGEKAAPGSLRTVQNYISRSGLGLSSISDAVYVPPPSELVPELLDNLFSYMSANDATPLLIKIALMHYQFEAIHPFLDGNGRIGRLLIMLYLIKGGALSQPFLYMSEYFEKNRDLYYKLLLNTSLTGDYYSWIKFFLRGIAEQAENAIAKFKSLIDYRSAARKLLSSSRSKKAYDLLDLLLRRQIITIPIAAKELGISYPAAKAAIQDMINVGILKNLERPEGRVKSIFIAQKILDIYNA